MSPSVSLVDKSVCLNLSLKSFGVSPHLDYTSGSCCVMHRYSSFSFKVMEKKCRYIILEKFLGTPDRKEFFLVICGFVDQGAIRIMEFL